MTAVDFICYSMSRIVLGLAILPRKCDYHIFLIDGWQVLNLLPNLETILQQ